MSADTCLVIRSDGQFLGTTASWHDKPDDALEFPNARMAARAVSVATRIDESLIAAIVSVEDYDASAYHLPTSAQQECA